MLYGTGVLTCNHPNCLRHEIVGIQQIPNPLNPLQYANQVVFLPRKDPQTKVKRAATKADFWKEIDGGRHLCPEHKKEQQQPAAGPVALQAEPEAKNGAQ